MRGQAMSESKELSFRGRRMSWVIETQGLSKSYGAITAVDNLSLKVPGGGVFGLLGPNGSGKTTTMGMLLGLIKPTAGNIRLFEDAAEGVHADALRRIGAIVEEPTSTPTSAAATTSATSRASRDAERRGRSTASWSGWASQIGPTASSAPTRRG